jgi:putative tricarboxylic transport membrane protein
MQNRFSGLFVSLFAIGILFVLIPGQTETVEGGWLSPATLPSIAAVIIFIAGAVHLFFPKGKAELNVSDAFRALIFLVIGIAGLWAMQVIGFVIAAPLMMLLLMIRIGERRWPWLVIGLALLPGFIWVCIDYLLKRPLP